jgi:hypothetical protein
MGYGHSSWIAAVIFGGLFLMRYLATQRRRGRPPGGGPGGRSPFTDPGSRHQAGGPTTAPPRGDGPPSTGMAAGWFRDPFVRHEQRYWSGTEWTEHVIDDGVPATDPPPASSGPRDPS